MKKTARRPGTPAPVPTWEALAQRSLDSEGISFVATIDPTKDFSQEHPMTKYRLADIDLAAGGNHWRTQKRDSHGRWAKTGATVVPGVPKTPGEELEVALGAPELAPVLVDQRDGGHDTG